MKILKWFILIIIVAGAGLAGFFFFKISEAESRFEATYQIEAEQIAIPTDSISLAKGAVWVNALCAECHGADLGGKLFFEDPDIGKIYTPNLTAGAYGLRYYQDNHWVNAIRHGVAASGRALFIMPSKDYTYFTAEDLGAIIAYLKTVPPVDREKGKNEFTNLGKFLVGIGAFGDVFSVEKIDHKAPIPEAKEVESVLDRGRYITKVGGCATCHGPDLKGADSPDPNSPPARDITSTGNLEQWNASQFKKFLRTGLTPEGTQIDNKFMPWQALGRLPENDQEAIFTYLSSLE